MVVQYNYRLLNTNFLAVDFWGDAYAHVYICTFRLCEMK